MYTAGEVQQPAASFNTIDIIRHAHSVEPILQHGLPFPNSGVPSLIPAPWPGTRLVPRATDVLIFGYKSKGCHRVPSSDPILAAFIPVEFLVED